MVGCPVSGLEVEFVGSATREDKPLGANVGSRYPLALPLCSPGDTYSKEQSSFPTKDLPAAVTHQ